MLEFSRILLKRFRGVCRKAGLTRSPPSVVVEADGSRLTLRLATPEAAIALRTRGAFAPERFFVPFDVLAAAESPRDEPVRIERADDRVIVSWNDRGVPQRRSAPAAEPPPAPESPNSTAANPRELLSALHEASLSTDDGPNRFALAKVQLQGLGRVVGTDGRQLYAHDGFAFPWREHLLVARTTAFGSPEFASVPGVIVGRTAKHVVVQAADWTVWLAIDAEGRFPKTDDVVPKPDRAHGTVTFDPADAAYLLDALPRLPAGSDGERAGVVLAIGESLAVETAGEAGTTRLCLPRSRREGVDLRLAVDRNYLARTLRLGFARLSYYGVASPVVAHDDRRRHVWAVLEASAAVRPISGPVETLEPPQERASFGTADVAPLSNSPEPTAVSVPVACRRTANARTTSEEPAGVNEAAPAEATSPIEQASRLQWALRQALAAASGLAASLRRQRRRDRTVRATLASLRQLQTLAE